MNYQEKIKELRNKIFEELTPLIDSDYILLDLPYHSNIGDLLIWEGEEAFLRTLPYKCLYKSSFRTYRYKKIPNNVIVLIHGGGNFGDTWRFLQDFHLDIIRQYPQNKIIIFPQTVYYHDEQYLKKDAEIMSQHTNLTICARDKKSYALLQKHFSNSIFCVPDMAFYINQKRLNRYKVNETKDILFFKRNDHEISQKIDYEHSFILKKKIETHDWPKKYWQQRLFHIISSSKNPYKTFTDKYVEIIYKSFLIRLGVEFLSQYKYIYTTRLHGAILSILLQKPLKLFDNSYGKNSSFYDTWLADVDNVEFIHE